MDARSVSESSCLPWTHDTAIVPLYQSKYDFPPDNEFTGTDSQSRAVITLCAEVRFRAWVSGFRFGASAALTLERSALEVFVHPLRAVYREPSA